MARNKPDFNAPVRRMTAQELADAEKHYVEVQRPEIYRKSYARKNASKQCGRNRSGMGWDGV